MDWGSRRKIHHKAIAAPLCRGCENKWQNHKNRPYLCQSHATAPFGHATVGFYLVRHGSHFTVRRSLAIVRRWKAGCVVWTGSGNARRVVRWPPASLIVSDNSPAGLTEHGILSFDGEIGMVRIAAIELQQYW